MIGEVASLSLALPLGTLALLDSSPGVGVRLGLACPRAYILALPATHIPNTSP